MRSNSSEHDGATGVNEMETVGTKVDLIAIAYQK